ncbi:hypothetical protein [Pedobacter mendelii]|uniref:hypothetical protein n=1 Tax=Pedobacter mendelii TaxID=1908240 RepID=UPI00362D5AED
MNKFSVDLTNCDKEPIHIPGKIQSHGLLIAVNKSDLNISYISDNASLFLKAPAKNFLEKPLTSLNSFIKQQEAEFKIEDLLKLGVIKKTFDSITPYPLVINENPFYLIISPSENDWLLEFEPVTLQYDIQSLIGRSASSILKGKSVSDLLKGAVVEVKKLIGYDRIMIYKFLDDGHGEVVAEEKESDLASFLAYIIPHQIFQSKQENCIN